MSEMSKIHIWIGHTNKDEDSYDEYFELDYSTEGDFDDPDYKPCQFCIDIGKKWYNEDFLGNIPLFDEDVEITKLLGQTVLAKDEVANVISKCNNLGIEEANAVFYYTDSELNIQEPYQENYNDLKYIGMFNSSLK